MSFIACAQPKCSYLLGTCASRHVVAVCQSLPHFSVGAINKFALEQDPAQGAAIQSLAQAQADRYTPVQRSDRAAGRILTALQDGAVRT